MKEPLTLGYRIIIGVLILIIVLAILFAIFWTGYLDNFFGGAPQTNTINEPLSGCTARTPTGVSVRQYDFSTDIGGKMVVNFNKASGATAYKLYISDNSSFTRGQEKFLEDIPTSGQNELSMTKIERGDIVSWAVFKPEFTTNTTWFVRVSAVGSADCESDLSLPQSLLFSSFVDCPTLDPTSNCVALDLAGFAVSATDIGGGRVQVLTTPIDSRFYNFIFIIQEVGNPDFEQYILLNKDNYVFQTFGTVGTTKFYTIIALVNCHCLASTGGNFVTNIPVNY